VGVGGAVIAGELEIAAGVRRRLGFLRLDAGGVHAFARDYLHSETLYVGSMLAQRPSWSRWKFRMHSMVRGPVDRLGLSHDARTRRRRLEEAWATLFLLSSDFFATGADAARVVRYVGLFDPMRACGNPFARPAVP
jgi:hypothetical protein